mgnify:CR=1 FL=1
MEIRLKKAYRVVRHGDSHQQVMEVVIGGWEEETINGAVVRDLIGLPTSGVEMVELMSRTCDLRHLTKVSFHIAHLVPGFLRLQRPVGIGGRQRRSWVGKPSRICRNWP